MDKHQRARTVRLTEQDEEAIAALKAYYGITSENEVIRLALRAALREITGNPSSAPQSARAQAKHA
jgi:Arc/MetJ family transcription regulator